MNEQVRKSGSMLLAVGMLALAGCATDPAAKQAREAELQRYLTFAGAPIHNFPYSTTGNAGWHAVGDEHIVLETRPSRSYLLHIPGPCVRNADTGFGLQLTSNTGQISKNFDGIIDRYTGMKCPIQEIRLMDLAAMRAAEKAAKKD